MMLKHVSVEDFEDEVLKSDVKVLVDFMLTGADHANDGPRT